MEERRLLRRRLVHQRRPLNSKTVECGNSELDVRDRFAVMLNYRLASGDRLHGITAICGERLAVQRH